MPRSKIIMNEAAVQRQVVKLLQTYGRSDICWWAVPNGGYRTALNGFQLKQQGVRSGAADLMFVIDSQFYGLELKTEVGKMSDNQTQFMQELSRAGGIYISAYGLEQAISALINIRAFKPDAHVSVGKIFKGSGMPAQPA